jgi:hypothetical protein
MTAPDFIFVGIRGVHTERRDRMDVPYIRRDPAVLAELPEVQALRHALQLASARLRQLSHEAEDARWSQLAEDWSKDAEAACAIPTS